MAPRIVKATTILAALFALVQPGCAETPGDPVDLVPAAIVASSAVSLTGTVATAVATPPSVKVSNAAGTGLPGIAVTFAVTAGGGTATGTAQVTDANGVATVGGWTLGTVAGANTMSASVAGLASLTFTAAAAAGPATDMVLTTSPSATAQVNAALAVQPALTFRDAHANVASTHPATVSAAISAGGGTIEGTTSASVTSGVATFTDLALRGTVGTRTIALSATGVASVTFDVELMAGPAHALDANAGDGQTATVGSAVTVNPSATVTDIDGNVVSGTTVTFAVTSGGGSVTGATPVTGGDGIATVGSWTLGTAPGANTLSATAEGLAGSPLTFTATGTAGEAFALEVVAGDGQAATVGHAVPTPPVVRVVDAADNPVSGVAVTFAVASGDGNLSGATPTTDANGLATLGSWTLGTTAGSNSISASATGLSGSPIILTATGTADVVSQLAFTTQPAQSLGGAVIPGFQVSLQDQYGNLAAAGSTDTLEISIVTNPAAGTLSGTTSVVASGGTASFTNVVLDKAGIGYVLSACRGGACTMPVSSASFDVVVGPAARIEFLTQPTHTIANAPLNPNGGVQATLYDAGGNVVTDATNEVTIALGTNPSGATLAGVTLLTPASGVVTLGSDIEVNLAGAGYTLTASASGLQGATSDPFDVAAFGPATAMVFKVQPVDAIVGAAIAPAVEVAIVDSYGNTVTSGPEATSSVTISASGNPAATLLGTLSAMATAGVATFSDVRVRDVNIGYQLAATTSTLTGPASASFDVSAGETLIATVPFEVKDLIITGATLVLVDSAGIATMPAAGGAITRIADDTLALAGHATDGTTVFWAGPDASGNIRINRVALAGGAVDTIATGLSFGTPPLKLDATYVYYAAAGQVRRLSKTATVYTLDELYDTSPSNGSGGVGVLELDGTDLIYSAGAEIRRAAAAGGGMVTIVASENPGAALTQSGTSLYYTMAVSCCDFDVRTVAATGGTPSQHASIPTSASRMGNDGTNLYMTSSFGLLKVPIAGGSYLTMDSFGAGRMAFDDTYVYWLRDLANTTEIYRAPR